MASDRCDPRDASPDVLAARLRERGFELPPGTVRVDGFGDNEALSRKLLAAIRGGRKRAGTSLVWAYEAEGLPIPAAGDMEIVVDHRNEPAMVLRFTDVAVVPFNAVTAEFAAREGEGDGTLAYWQQAHRPFFERECARIGRQPSDTMPVVCAAFEVLFLA